MSSIKYIPFSINTEFEKVNEEFVKSKILVMSYEQVANGTKFTKQSITNAISTINYVPVIGYFTEGDFQGHGIEYKITDTDFEEVVKTVPFGVVIKDSARFENVVKDNGQAEEYLVVDAYLWSRYSEAINVIKDNKCNQSMEINVHGGGYNSDYSVYNVDDFTFSALCVLGEDVTPAFNLAKIRTTNNFNKVDDFKAIYSEMTVALDRFLNIEEGGVVVDEEVKVEFEDEKPLETPIVETEVKEEQFEEVKEIETPVEPEVVLDSFEDKYNELLVKYNELESKFTALETEANELREYKAVKEFAIRQAKESELFAQFTELKENDEFKTLQKESNLYTLEELENKCFALLGRAKFNKKIDIKEDIVVFNLAETLERSEGAKASKYDLTIQKYLKK